MFVTKQKQKKKINFFLNCTIPKNEGKTIEFRLMRLMIIFDFDVIIVQLFVYTYVHIYLLHYFFHLYPTVYLQGNTKRSKKIEGYCHHLKIWVKEVSKEVDFRLLS